MKSYTPVLLLCVMATLCTNAARASSPREELAMKAARLQSSPGDDSLRARIILIARDLKPAPAIPEEAERRMARGMAAFKGATSAAELGPIP
jgi:hypothetical protein